MLLSVDYLVVKIYDKLMKMKNILLLMCCSAAYAAEVEDGEIPPWLLEEEAAVSTAPADAAPEPPAPERIDVGPLSEPSPELIAELTAHIQEAMAAVCPTAKGGPGLSEESAWVLGPDVYPDTNMLSAVLPEDYEEFDAAYVQGENGRTHWVMVFHLRRGGKVYEFAFWVDIDDAAIIPADEIEEPINAEEEAEEGAVDID